MIREVTASPYRKAYRHLDASHDAAPRRRLPSLRGVLIATAVALVLLSLGAPRHGRQLQGQTFDPNAIDGADTISRVELGR